MLRENIEVKFRVSRAVGRGSVLSWLGGGFMFGGFWFRRGLDFLVGCRFVRVSRCVGEYVLIFFFFSCRI